MTTRSEFLEFQNAKAQDCPVGEMIIKYREVLTMIEKIQTALEDIRKKEAEINQLKWHLEYILELLER